jgi:hypothetical protein
MVSHNVMVSFLGEEFDREAPHIPNGICTALLAAGSTKTEQNWSLLADSIQELGRGERRNVVGHFELAPGTGSLSMNNSVQFS